MALSLCSVNHISKVVTDVEKSLRFYKEVSMLRGDLGATGPGDQRHAALYLPVG